MLWTDQQIDELTRLWNTEMSCSQIGAAMHLSRNAIIGKVHRLGLPLRGKPKPVVLTEQEAAMRAQKAREANTLRLRARRANGYVPPSQAAAQIRLPPPKYEGSLNIPYCDLRDFSTTEANQCRFIADEVTGRDALACGTETLPGASYCGHCNDIVHYRAREISDEDHERRREHAMALMDPLPLAKFRMKIIPEESIV